MLRVLHPKMPPPWPFDSFRLLFLGQGYEEHEEVEFLGVCGQAMERIRGIDPFGALGASGPSSKAVTVYAEFGADLDLELARNGDVLALPPRGNEVLQDHLLTLSYEVSVEEAKAAEMRVSPARLWPPGARGGPKAGLIVLLKKAQPVDTPEEGPAELFQLDPDDPDALPVVAVLVTGSAWHLCVARALGQLLGGLADEFERPGPKYEQPASIARSGPNVVYLSAEQRERLISGADGRQVVPVVNRWPHGETMTFFEYGRDRSLAGLVGAQLVEGGDGYRKGVLRGGFDCLMRRAPAGVLPRGSLDEGRPIQDSHEPASFCVVCRDLLRRVMGGEPSHSESSTWLDSQESVYDRTKWKQTGTELPRPFTLEGARPSLDTPALRWSCDVEVTDDGLVIRNLRLSNRAGFGDPFAAAEDVLGRIEFVGLSITFADDPPTQLRPSEASRPELEYGKGDSGDSEYLGGLRCTMQWHLRGYTIEARFSLVLGDCSTESDPGGKRLGCAIYPQLSLGFEPSTEDDAPEVRAFHGRIELLANNRISPDIPLSDLRLRPMFTGKQLVGLYAESNGFDDGDLDHAYDLEPGHAGLWKATRRHGRLLAAVPDGHESLGAALLHELQLGRPGLPLWSWIYDHAASVPEGKQSFVAAYAAGESDMFSIVRSPWPEGEKSALFSRRVPRQGEYDCLRIGAFLGSVANDGQPTWEEVHGRELDTAPLAFDVCLELRWRWGSAALANAGATTTFVAGLGWDGERQLGRAGTTRDAPLVPPSQHVEIHLDKLPDGETLVAYDVTVPAPRAGRTEVFLEQGLRFFFAHAGLRGEDLAVLGAAANVFDRDVEDSLRALDRTRDKDPMGFAVELRRSLRQIAPRMRFLLAAGPDAGGLSAQVPVKPSAESHEPNLTPLRLCRVVFPGTSEQEQEYVRNNTIAHLYRDGIRAESIVGGYAIFLRRTIVGTGIRTAVALGDPIVCQTDDLGRLCGRSNSEVVRFEKGGEYLFFWTPSKAILQHVHHAVMQNLPLAISAYPFSHVQIQIAEPKTEEGPTDELARISHQGKEFRPCLPG